MHGIVLVHGVIKTKTETIIPNVKNNGGKFCISAAKTCVCVNFSSIWFTRNYFLGRGRFDDQYILS